MTAVLTEPDLCELSFPGGVAGFPESVRYALVDIPGITQLFRLISLDQDDLEFVVAPPVLFFPDYAPEIDDASAERLGLVDAADALLLVVLTVGEDMATTTANLLAPIVIHERTRVAAQIALNDDWPLRAPLAG